MPRSGSLSAPPSATAMRPRSAARAASRRDGYPRLPALRRGVAWSVRSSVLSVDTGLNAGLRYGQPDELFHFIFSSGVSSAKCYDAPCRLSNECGRMGAIQTDVELKLLAKSILQLRRIGCSPGSTGSADVLVGILVGLTICCRRGCWRSRCCCKGSAYEALCSPDTSTLV